MYPKINGMSSEFYDSMMNGIVREIFIRDNRLLLHKTNLVVAKKSVINSMNSEYASVIDVLDEHHNLTPKQDVWYVMWRIPRKMEGVGYFNPILGMLAEIHKTDVLEIDTDNDGEKTSDKYLSIRLGDTKGNPILIEVPGIQNFRSLVDNGKKFLKS